MTRRKTKADAAFESGIIVAGDEPLPDYMKNIQGERPKRVPRPPKEGELSPRSSVHDIIHHFNIDDYVMTTHDKDNEPLIIISDKFSDRMKRRIEGWFFIANGRLRVEWSDD